MGTTMPFTIPTIDKAIAQAIVLMAISKLPMQILIILDKRVLTFVKIFTSLGIEHPVLIAAVAAVAFGGSRAFARSFIADETLEIGSIMNIAQGIVVSPFHCGGDRLIVYLHNLTQKSPVDELAGLIHS